MGVHIGQIDLGTVQNLEDEITTICGNQEFAGFKLASTFVYGTKLILIFQD